MQCGYLQNLRHVAVSTHCGWHRTEFKYEWKLLGQLISSLAGDETTVKLKANNEVDVGIYEFDFD